jgi:hypothetical protein
MVELYLHSLICFHVLVLNYLGTKTALPFYTNNKGLNKEKINKRKNSNQINQPIKLRGLVHQRTIPTEPQPLVGEDSANISG